MLRRAVDFLGVKFIFSVVTKDGWLKKFVMINLTNRYLFYDYFVRLSFRICFPSYGSIHPCYIPFKDR